MTHIHDILIDALEELKSADVPQELWLVAFPKVLDLLSAEGVGPSGPGDGSGEEGRTALVDSGAVGLTGISRQLRLDEAVIREVFDLGDGALDVVVSTAKLSPRSAAATKELALLLVAGNQAAGLKEWTSASEIRAMCEAHKRLDSANFAATVAEMHEAFRVRGTGRKREYSMSKPGWDLARGLVSRLGGSPQ
jgi:hypothetical protein